MAFFFFRSPQKLESRLLHFFNAVTNCSKNVLRLDGGGTKLGEMGPVSSNS